MTSIAVIAKVAERCNIACDYCYMYEGEDNTWRRRPRFLSSEHATRLISRVEEFLDADPDNDVVLEIHGGEPLLWGQQRFESFLHRVRGIRDSERVTVCVQTNGTLLDRSWIDLFLRLGVFFSISCDGPAADHDLHRRGHDDRPTASRVHEAIGLAVETDPRGRYFGGVLAVADLDRDPAPVLRFFHDMGVRSVDLLLPDTTRVTARPDMASKARRYLTAALDTWVSLDDPAFKYRFMEDFLLGVLGHASSLDALGGDLGNLMVVESDGSLQLLDVLRICAQDAAWTGKSIDDVSLSEFLAYSSTQTFDACAQCRSCPAFAACGGGYLPHRFDGTSYDNPSAYCDAMLGLHRHIQQIFQTLPLPRQWASAHSTSPSAPSPAARLGVASL